MPRTCKNGILYFPFDVYSFDDDVMSKLSIKFGPLGECVYLRILCMIYKNGYFYKFDSIDSLSSLITKQVGGKWIRNKHFIPDIISLLIDLNALSADLFAINVLSSLDIQKQYALITNNRKSFSINEFSLLVPTPSSQSSAYIKRNQIEIENKSKSKFKSKLKLKRKVKGSRLHSVSFHFMSLQKRFNVILEKYHAICYKLSPVKKVTDNMKFLIKDNLKHFTLNDYVNAFKAASENTFLMSPEKKWMPSFEWIIKPDNLNKILNGNFSSWDSKSSAINPNSSFDTDEFFELALKKSYSNFNK